MLINTKTIETYYLNDILNLINTLKKDEKNGWEVPIESSLKIVELLKNFHKVHFLLSEILDLKLDFDDFYKSISCSLYDSDGSAFNTVDYPDIKIIKAKLDIIFVALQKVGLEEKRMENLFTLAFIVNKCECKYDINSNFYVNKLQICLDDIDENIINDFSEIMEFTKEQDRDIYKIIHDNDDIVSIDRICNNSNIIISDKIVLQEILSRISRNGTLNKIITISERLCKLKLQICNL